MKRVQRSADSKDLREGGRIILAHGEVTGHCHEVVAEPGVELPAAQFFEEPDGTRVLLVDQPVTLTHQEHSAHRLYPDGRAEKLEQGLVVETREYPAQVRQGDVFLAPIAPGAWKQLPQSEYHPEEIRQVLD